MTRSDFLVAVLLCSSLGTTSYGQTVDDFVGVLVPLESSLPNPGAYGSFWTTELWVYNASDEPVELTPNADPDLPPCMILCPSYTIPPRTSFRVTTGRSFSAEGGILYVERENADSLKFSPVIVREPALFSQGVAIPVVRTDRLEAGRDSVLVNVPISQAAREHLRLYSPGSLTTAVIVRVFDLEEGELLSETEHQLRHLPLGVEEDGISERLPKYPAFAFLDLEALVSVQTNVRVEVEPQNDDAKVWALATVTSNSTQRVTAYFPLP